METKKSSVKRVVHNTGTFNAHGSIMYKHLIEFDNGDKGDYNSKSETCTKFIEGKEAEYTIEANGNYNAKIKPVQEQSGGYSSKGNSPETQRLIARQTALKCAAELHTQSSTATDIVQVLDDAELMYKWIMTETK